MSRTILTGVVALLGACVVGSAAPAFAASDDGNSAIIKVTFTEADLHTVQGARSLAARLRLAADRACIAQAPWSAASMPECREKAIAGAIKDLHAPLLTDALGPSHRPAVASR
jgi:UrcA family protein